VSEDQNTEQLSDPAEEHRVDLNPEGEGDGYSDHVEQEAETSQDDSGSEPDETPEAPDSGPVEVAEETETVVTTDDIKRQARDRKWKQVDAEDSDES